MKGRGLVNSSAISAPGDEFVIAINSDVTADDSDKTVTVPAGQLWQILSIFVSLATTATAGDRQLQILFADDTAQELFDQRPNVVQAESLIRRYSFGPSMANQVAFYDTDHIQTPLPPTLFLAAGYTIRVWDNNAVDAAADDMEVTITYASRG